ncbi:MAG: hypothetical protein FWC16_03220 [Defluviitaleaceae bacterium]|nr:hypothetical protein [Defluviitaleaceae bacterium]MCL2273913.1 hypothetical protein [Defluviitaleaceae bacterium]
MSIFEEKAILFGAGDAGRTALHHFGFDKVACFVDNNPNKARELFLGKKIISFDEYIITYKGKAGFRLYLTSNHYANELAEQLLSVGIYEFTNFYDFLPGIDELVLLVGEYNICKGDKIALVGTSNYTEYVIKALHKTDLLDCVVALFAAPDNCKLINYHFRGYPVQDINELKTTIHLYDFTIVGTGIGMFYTSADVRNDYESLGAKIIFANEATKYIGDDERERKATLVKIDPHKILSSNRLDISIRYLLFKDIVHGIDDEKHKSLYARMILSLVGGEEKIGTFTAQAKHTVHEFIEKAEELCVNIKENGFDKNHYIPVAENTICNGAHRIAAALALNEKVWVNFYPFTHESPNYTFDWFVNNGFNLEERIKILRTFADLYSSCGIFILFYPAFPHWEYIRAQLSKKLRIVGDVDLDFTNNYFAFHNVINEMYSVQGIKIKSKINILKFAPLKLKIVLVSDENNINENLYGRMTYIKQSLRDNLSFDTDKNGFCLLHGCDKRSEFLHMKNVLLSHNNLNHYKMMINIKYRDEFLTSIDRFKQYCAITQIDLNDVCIVGGSVLEVFDIRQSKTEIDFVPLTKHRKLFGNSRRTVETNIDVRPLRHIQIGNDKYLEDDVLINNDAYHFIFFGCKFANLDIIRLQKKHDSRSRKKDKDDVKLIEIFQDFAMFFDEKEQFKKQLTKELERRRSHVSL